MVQMPEHASIEDALESLRKTPDETLRVPIGGPPVRVRRPDFQATTSLTPPTPTVEDILEERGKTHGSFPDNARISQSLKRIFHSEVGWDKLTDVQREVIHMSCLKLARIITGDQNVKDHWDDIAGYAKLASKEIK